MKKESEYLYIFPRIAVTKLYSVKKCNANSNPDNYKIFIFGDNQIRSGMGGQAVIRYCSNAIGIPTKRYPTMDKDAFFSDDNPNDSVYVLNAIDNVKKLYDDTTNITLVFPADGLGTGLAKMKEKAPILYYTMCCKLKEFFNYDNENGYNL